ncbi:MobA/MobL family protein [Candidatus Tisiphia endosymbiont of Nemotelus uliginosus]|uniref:MobA/MobL family protein n=1 Tax=Candidatus Tisiphia endosymbiont of Nemotelus uliginosus TaxID=3077926 RepID=UPI0035C927BF
MAIYHLNKSSVQRSEGQSAVASAAYISGSKLTYNIVDGDTNVELSRTFDYSNKLGLAFSQILAPDNAPSWVYNREELWSKAEAAEGRINARPAYKFITALPKELTLEQNIELAQQFATKYLVSSGMVADVNIHYDNENNPRCNAMTTDDPLLVGFLLFAMNEQNKQHPMLKEFIQLAKKHKSVKKSQST